MFQLAFTAVLLYLGVWLIRRAAALVYRLEIAEEVEVKLFDRPAHIDRQVLPLIAPIGHAAHFEGAGVGQR